MIGLSNQSIKTTSLALVAVKWNASYAIITNHNEWNVNWLFSFGGSQSLLGDFALRYSCFVAVSISCKSYIKCLFHIPCWTLCSSEPWSAHKYQTDCKVCEPINDYYANLCMLVSLNFRSHEHDEDDDGEMKKRKKHRSG